VKEVAVLIGEISAASEQQSGGIGHVSEAIGQMDQVNPTKCGVDGGGDCRCSIARRNVSQSERDDKCNPYYVTSDTEAFDQPTYIFIDWSEFSGYSPR
jgi:hypothetical protein